MLERRRGRHDGHGVWLNADQSTGLPNRGDREHGGHNHYNAQGDEKLLCGWP